MTKSMLTIKTGLIVLLLGFSGALSADELSVPVSQQSNTDMVQPKHGQSMQQIELNFGEPIIKQPAVGQPPITRWQYASFTVYFEGNIVIRSVAHRS